jgi:hypothetical protein
MTLSQYRSSSSWLGAIELGPKLMNLAEELPASEEMGLSLQLRQLMVELPATVAADLVQGTDTRQVVAFRLLSTLELVDRVYPALDTAGLRADADSLVERLMSADQFAAGPEPVPVAAAPEAEPLDVPTLEPADTPVLPTEVTEAADVAAPTTEVVAEVPVVTPAPIEPTSVPVSTEPTP